MPYHLQCDDCGLDRTVEDHVVAHELAKDHEAEHPKHYVSVRMTEGPE
jgi:hypothetical protein